MDVQRIRLNAAEMQALRGLPYAWRCLYLELRWRMDIATGSVGMVAGAGVSWFTLREALFIEPASGRSGAGTPKESTVRHWARGLQSAGLLTFQTIGKRLIFNLTLAELGYSAKNKVDSMLTVLSADMATGENTLFSACENSDIGKQPQGEFDTHPDTPPPPNLDTPLVSGKSTNNTVVLFANETSSSACPHREIIKLWSEILPMCPKPNASQWRGTRATHLRTRWAEDPKRQNLQWWQGLFQYIAKSEWFTGRKEGANGTPFLISLTWLVNPKNFYRVVEGEIR